MRPLILTLHIFFLFLFHAGASGFVYPYLFTTTDSIPPPPPGGPSPLSGPAEACVGETSEFTVDVPVGCTCQWSVNGNVQPGSASSFTITWGQSGLQLVSVVFICNGGSSDPVSISVIVFETPQPQPISGEEFVCEFTYHTYSTLVGPYDSCQWTVNGEIQPGYAPFMTYAFGASGTYLVEVIGFNPCGTSEPQTLEVTAQGTAPAMPAPIEGPDISCEGNTETYSTTVGPEESCSWWIDGVLQPTTASSLAVTWSERGNHLIEVRAVSDCGTGNPAFKSVQVYYQPAVFLGNDTTILQGQTLLLDAGNPGSDYLWSTGAATQTITVSASGTYSVNVSNFCGADADTIEVSVVVGLNEIAPDTDCFSMKLQQRRIDFVNLPPGRIKIELVSMSGMVIYEGPRIQSITVDEGGIYLVRAVSGESGCTLKVFIP